MILTWHDHSTLATQQTEIIARARRPGIYGIGGGSLLAPILVGCGFAVRSVAPAALLGTFATSLVGVGTYVAIALLGESAAAPDTPLGIAAGLGGLVGGYIGAALAPRMPQEGLRKLLGVLSVLLALAYFIQVVV